MPIHKFGHKLALCASPEKLVYVARSCKAAAVYDVFQDKWDLLPQMPDSLAWPRGFYIDGMFYVVNIKGTFDSVTYRFDPKIQRWQALQRFELLRFSPMSFEAVYVLLVSGTKIIMVSIMVSGK
ncbi:hypothetical protein SUGI_0707560 [Cryptomeria japonica]|nr:hypothetical protein SUGI_0707560 [Cryptomeria japonica]